MMEYAITIAVSVVVFFVGYVVGQLRGDRLYFRLYKVATADRDDWHKKAEDYRVMYESGSVEVGKWRHKADLAERKIAFLGVALEDGDWQPDSEYKGLLRFDWYEKAAEAVEDSPKVVTGVKLIPTILSRETVKEEGDDG